MLPSPAIAAVFRLPAAKVLFGFGGTLASQPGCVQHQQIRTIVREPMAPGKPGQAFQSKIKTADEAIKMVQSGHSLFLQGAAATPLALVDALTKHGKNAGLKDVDICHIHTEGKASYMEPDCKGIFRANCFFVGGNARPAVNEGRADFVPIFLSEIPLLFHRKQIKLDGALISVTPPDKHGFCSFGTSVDVTRAALQNAKYIIAQINDKLPKTFGDGVIHVNNIDVLVDHSKDLPEHPHKKMSDAEVAIGKLIAENLVDNGATLQMGIGAIPDAVLACLTNHKHLGVHSEMFSDGLIELIEKGCVTNHLKNLLPGKTVTAFCTGTKKLFDFIHDNPFIHFKEVLYTNSSAMIARNPKVTAINSAIEIDLTGQVVADSIGTRIYSGIGGQVDFLRGAAIGFDGKGKPILALPSTTRKGDSKIAPTIRAGGGVVTTRAHVHYVVTEHGIAYLFGKNLRQRAYELIKISHPDHREKLEKAAFDRLKVMPSA